MPARLKLQESTCVTEYRNIVPIRTMRKRKLNNLQLSEIEKWWRSLLGIYKGMMGFSKTNIDTLSAQRDLKIGKF